MSIIPDHHDVAVPLCQPFDDIRLNGIGILLFIHHDVAILLAQLLPDLLML